MKKMLKPILVDVIVSSLMLCVPIVLAGCDGNKTAEHDHEGHSDQEHGGDIKLDAEQLAAAGIKTAKAGPGTIEETLRLVAHVSSNENTLVHINSRVAGVVQTIYKGLGERVRAGEPMAEIWSVELGNTVSGYLAARESVIAELETLAKAKELFGRRLKTLTELLDGEIAVATRIYEREKELQDKSISTIRPFLEADKALQRARLGKNREITTLEAARDMRLLEIDIALRRARIAENAAADRLRVLGLMEKEIEELPKTKSRYGRMVIRAPRDGVVMRRHITVNEHVETETILFETADLRTVWILASAYEKDLASVRVGQKAIIQLNALPGVTLSGEVGLIDFSVSQKTRTTAVRIEIENEAIESWGEQFPLRPGMFGSLELVVRTRAAKIVVPETAIVREGGTSFVFVQEEPGTFERKPVKIVRGARGLVEILEGVEPGEPVVVSGTFTLKSMARGGELGGGHSH